MSPEQLRLLAPGLAVLLAEYGAATAQLAACRLAVAGSVTPNDSLMLYALRSPPRNGLPRCASVRECHQTTTRAPPLPATRLARVEVRPEAIRDRSAVRALHVAAFGEDHVPVVAKRVDALRDVVRRGEGLSLVAAE